MSAPTISVVMPVYNSEKYLYEAIDSILNQTYTNFEFIILNDGSIDKIEEIILSYDDQRIVYVKNEENLQIVKTLNKGISLAKGKYIARMDADDISLPERLERQIEFMESNPDIDVCGTGYIALGKKRFIFKPLKKHEYIKIKLLFTSPLAHPTVLMKKEIFDDYQYDEGYPKAEDYALWIQLINHFTFANISDPLLYYRIHDNQTTVKYDTLQLDSTRKVMKKYLANIMPEKDILESNVLLHQDISLRKRVDIDLAEDWLLKLIKNNNDKAFFSQDILTENIFELWRSQCFSQTGLGLSLLNKFYKSELFLSGRLSALQHVKFIIKCLLKYQK